MMVLGSHLCASTQTAMIMVGYAVTGDSFSTGTCIAYTSSARNEDFGDAIAAYRRTNAARSVAQARNTHPRRLETQVACRRIAIAPLARSHC